MALASTRAAQQDVPAAATSLAATATASVEQGGVSSSSFAASQAQAFAAANRCATGPWHGLAGCHSGCWLHAWQDITGHAQMVGLTAFLYNQQAPSREVELPSVSNTWCIPVPSVCTNTTSSMSCHDAGFTPDACTISTAAPTRVSCPGPTTFKAMRWPWLVPSSRAVHLPRRPTPPPLRKLLLLGATPRQALQQPQPSCSVKAAQAPRRSPRYVVYLGIALVAK